MHRRLALATIAVLTVACAAQVKNIPGTQTADTQENRAIIEVVERYRLGMEQRDVRGLLSLAAKTYYQPARAPYTPYGYEGLAEVLASELAAAESVRYSMRYGKIVRQGDRATVAVLVDASFTYQTARGPERKDLRDENQLVLEWDGKRWLFISGM